MFKKYFTIFLLCLSLNSIYASDLKESANDSFYMRSSVPFVNCLIGAFLAKDTGTPIALACSAGLILGLIDDYAVKQDLQDQHLLTTALVGASMMQPLHEDYGIYIGAVLAPLMRMNLVDSSYLLRYFHHILNGALLTEILTYPIRSSFDEEDGFHLDKKLKIIHGLILTSVLSSDFAKTYFTREDASVLTSFKSLFDHFQSDKNFQSNFDMLMTLMMGSNVVSMKIFDLALHNSNKLWYAFSDQNFEEMNKKSIHLISASMFYFIVSSFFNYLQNDLENHLFYEMKDSIDEKYFEEENALKLSNQKDLIPLIQHLGTDFQILRFKGSDLIKGELSNRIQEIHSFSTIYGLKAFDLYCAILTYNIIVGNAVAYFTEQSTAAKQEIVKLASRQNMIGVDSIDKADLLILNQKMQALGKKKKHLNHEERDVAFRRSEWDSFPEVWMKINGYIAYALTSKVLGSKLQDGSLLKSSTSPLNTASKKITDVWRSMNAQKISLIELALSHVETVIRELDAPNERLCHHLERNFISSDETYLEFKDVHVYSSDESKQLKIPSLKLKPGFYAVVGKSGTGKSTLMKKIFGLENNGICASGVLNFHFAGEGRQQVYMLTQDFYALPESSLFEVVTGYRPEEVSEERYQSMHARVVDLFKELEVDEFVHANKGLILELDVEKDWNSPGNLSGGQRKKVALAALIFAMEEKAYPFVIIDEIFSGLDPEHSLPLVKKVLKKYLHNAVILVVDHGNQDFFEYELQFKEETVHLVSSYR